jgi:hypothetical protein
VLFEAIQDVAILDSSSAPTAICIYQVKKKERREWEWSDLTSLPQPDDPSKSTGKSKKQPKKSLADVQGSPIGKLYAAVNAVKTLKTSGGFISNVGCNLPLADGSNAATSLPSALAALSPQHLDLLSKALATLHARGEPVPDLSRIHLERVAVPVNDPGPYIVGLVSKFLTKRSPRHAGQAQALVDALLVAIKPLGAKTDTCKTFDELRKERGYSKSEFVNALGQLENVPDLLEHLDDWLNRLVNEGMGFMDITAIRNAAAAIYRRQVMGSKSLEETKLSTACDTWLNAHADSTNLKPFFEAAYTDLHGEYPSMKKSELLAHFALMAIKKCVDQI